VGNFVPYATIVASADLSIQRLIEDKSWPAECPCQHGKKIDEQPEVHRN
jgi:hypothetical protein